MKSNKSTIDKALLASLASYNQIKDKKYEEASKTVGEIYTDNQSKNIRISLLKAHLALQSKQVENAINFIKDVIDADNLTNLENASLFSLALRMAKNYKLIDKLDGFI